jgi:putative spermidine/putrescine transport system substrate-binding protein
MDNRSLAAENRSVSRRALLASSVGAIGAGVFPRLSRADANEVVLAVWGGPAAEAFKTIYGGFYTAKTGVPVMTDDSGPEPAKLRAMVEANQVTWDVADLSTADSILLGRAGLVRPMDYSIVSKDAILPGFAYEFGATSYIFSSIIAFDKQALGGNVPASWADVWNVQKFPGKRALRKHIEGVIESALLADGVPIDRIYPIDEDRAFKKIKEILPNTVFWSSGSESQQLMRDGEVVMGNLWSTRATQLAKEGPERFGLDFNGGLLLPACWGVPAKNPGGSKAFDFVAAAQDPESQAKVFKASNLSPSNPAADAFVTGNDALYNPTSKVNAAKQLPVNVQWYIDNQERVQTRFLEVIGG